MTPVDASAQATQLAAMVRARLATQLRAETKGHAASASAAPPESVSADAPDLPDAGTCSEAQMQQLTALRVRALSRDDPRRQRKAFGIFLASVLAQALGRGRLDEPGFDQLVEAVLQQMEGDAELQAALHEAGRRLLADAAPIAPPTGGPGTV